MEKAILRREFSARRDSLSQEERVDLSSRVASRVVGLDEWKAARVVGLYVPIRSEVLTQPLLAQALAAGKATAIPRIEGDALHYHPIDSFSGLASGALGVPEPTSGNAIIPDLLIVPGLAFDTEGGRLGYGRGYFDRLLGAFQGVSIALAYDFQLVARLPQEAHDVPVSIVATEARILRAPKTRFVEP
ncbi:MAG: 5-formyltetrahydrofolate cyclo-ligase [Thermoplasmatota archaeon]